MTPERWIAWPSSLALALQPLGTAVADLPSFQAFMNRLGWDAQALTSEWSALATKVGDVVTALNALRAARSVAAALALLEKIAAVYRALQAITTAPPGVADPGAFLADIARRVFELLLVEYLTEARPTVAALLRAAGVITETPHAEEPDRPLYVETRFHFEELGRNVSDPGSIPGRVYGWGTDDLDFELLVTHLHELALVVGLDVRLGRADPVLAAGLQAPADQTARGIATQLTFVLAELTILGEPVEVALAALELPPESGHPAAGHRPAADPTGRGRGADDRARLEAPIPRRQRSRPDLRHPRLGRTALTCATRSSPGPRRRRRGSGSRSTTPRRRRSASSANRKVFGWNSKASRQALTSISTAES